MTPDFHCRLLFNVVAIAKPLTNRCQVQHVSRKEFLSLRDGFPQPGLVAAMSATESLCYPEIRDSNGEKKNAMQNRRSRTS